MAVSVSKAWLLFILVIAILAVNSKLAAGDHRHTRRELAADIPGFLTLSCGLPANSSFVEETSGISYISDADYIDTGISRNLPLQIKDNNEQYFWNLRSFPDGIRNCYTINIVGGSKYLIRTVFLYGNYDEEENLPEFDLHLGANKWDTVKIVEASKSVWKELIHVTSLNYIQICLVNKNLGTPFISTIELRQLLNTTYETTAGSLALRYRYDVGNTNSDQIRYPDDVYDRFWNPYEQDSWTELSTNLFINDRAGNRDYKPPSIVKSTAATPKDDSAPLEFSWEKYDDESGYYYVYMYFAEVVKPEANHSRLFNISYNYKNSPFGPLELDYLTTTLVYDTGSLSYGSGRTRNFSIVKTEKSTLPPIINAFEIYSVKYFAQSETHKKDVDSITKIKSIYGIKRNWQGDPCAPKPYFWKGLNCSYDDSNPPRITSLNLSSSGLMGAISDDISNLVMLQILDLSNNSLYGSVPYSLSQLPHLKVLNLEGNQLTGSVPIELIERSNHGSLSLRVGENPNLCGVGSCKTKNNAVVPIVASVAGLLILSLIFGGGLWWRRRSKKQNATADTKSTTPNVPLEPIHRQFTYFELQSITNNFSRILGKGGFGTVYHGYIDDTQVAVKIMSASSAHGYQQFQSEVKLLMSRVHHRNLTTLFGYCHEGTNVGLIYEFMAKGDLEAYLSDADDKKANILTWGCRLQIAIDAAQGLEYLHHGSKPPIVHRDVKCTNILLSENFQSKLADFGMSKIFPADADSHVSTVVVGTRGYVDPEYYLSNRLTEKSDVYSFGVVLLRIITGRPVMERSREMTQTHISQWVSFMLANGDIRNIVDPRMPGNLDVNSVWKAIEIAMSCVSPTSVRRPNMSQVVGELKECLATEMTPIEMVNMDLTTEVVLYPSAR